MFGALVPATLMGIFTDHRGLHTCIAKYIEFHIDQAFSEGACIWPAAGNRLGWKLRLKFSLPSPSGAGPACGIQGPFELSGIPCRNAVRSCHGWLRLCVCMCGIITMTSIFLGIVGFVSLFTPPPPLPPWRMMLSRETIFLFRCRFLSNVLPPPSSDKSWAAPPSSHCGLVANCRLLANPDDWWSLSIERGSFPPFNSCCIRSQITGSTFLFRGYAIACCCYHHLTSLRPML